MTGIQPIHSYQTPIPMEVDEPHEDSFTVNPINLVETQNPSSNAPPLKKRISIESKKTPSKNSFSGEEGSDQKVTPPTKADFSDLLAPLGEIQKKMKLGSLIMVASAVALTVLGIAFIAVGSGFLGLLPLIAAAPLFYIGYNSFRVSENLARIINNPEQVLSSNQIIQIDSQKIKQSLNEKTFFFDWAIDKGTDYLLNSKTFST